MAPRSFYQAADLPQRESLLAEYLQFMSDRNGIFDPAVGGYVRRQAHLQRLQNSTIRYRGQIDSEHFHQLYDRFRLNSDLDRALLVALAFVRLNAGEAYGHAARQPEIDQLERDCNRYYNLAFTTDQQRRDAIERRLSQALEAAPEDVWDRLEADLAEMAGRQVNTNPNRNSGQLSRNGALHALTPRTGAHERTPDPRTIHRAADAA